MPHANAVKRQYAVSRLPDEPKSGAVSRQRIVVDERGMIDLPFLILTILLSLIGLVMMFSASYARAYMEEGNSSYYFVRQAGFVLGGIVIMMLVSKVNYEWLRLFSFWAMVLAVVLLVLVAIPGIGRKEGGARRWLYLGIGFQPSEIAKAAVVIYFAALMTKFKDRMTTFRYGVVPYVAILLLIGGLLYLEPHLSCTVIIFCTGAAMMWLGGTQKRWFALLGVGVALVVFLVIRYPALLAAYAGERITAWLDPFSDPGDSGYQITQSLYAIGSGGLLGLGLGKSRQKYLYLPEEHNDYIFSIVCEELGFVGAMVILTLFVLLIVRGYWVAMRASDRYGMLLAGGFTTLLALQVFFNIGVVTNFLPATGISLPFFSYGGTALLIQFAEMGVILSVSRQNKAKLK